MTQTPTTFDVIVVGAGPVGMTAAALLGSGGATVLVLEKNTGTSDEPKAISIDDEALRTYASAGLDRRILSTVVPGTGTRYYDAEGRAVFQAGAEVPYRLGYPFKNPFAQPDLERLLLSALTDRTNVTVRFDSRLVGLVTDDLGATVDYETAGSRHRANARFVLGADGGRSTVRALAGIELAGRSYDEDWLVIDTLDDPHRERYGMHHGDPRRPHVIVPGLGGRCRYEFRLFAGEGSAGDEPSFELIRSLVAPYRAIAPSDVERAVIYRFHGLIATEWRKGSAFLLGDAAHMMPPFAGQGLNSGIRDAANLCWKLLGVLKDKAPATILDSYQRERYGHALATIRLSEKLGRVVMTTSSRVAAARDEAVRKALTTPAGRAFFEYMRYRPSARFTSGLVLSDTHERAGRQLGQPRVFDTAAREVRMLDDVLGLDWAIIGVSDGSLLRDPDLDAFARARGIPVFDLPLADMLPLTDDGRSVLVDVDGRLIEEFTDLGGRFVLLRPDHVIAAAWLPETTTSVLAKVCSWLRSAS